MISLADIVGLPAKVAWPITFSLKKKMNFVWLLCPPPAGQQHIVSGLRLLKFTNLKHNDVCYYY